MKILITGGTGFIGRHVIQAVIGAGHEVIALKRAQSHLDGSTDFLPQVLWLNLDAPDWCQRASAEKPEVIIHCAWAGVSAAERADWKLQATNLTFFTDLLQIASASNLKRFIAFGSQAEYGAILGRVNESHPCLPATAYGATKLACLTLLAGFARQQHINHVWLRLFSVYGPGERGQWFIPSLIHQMQAGQAPRLTGGEQRYDYLHVRDLAAGVLAVLQCPEPSGIFNLSSNTSLTLREVAGLIKKYTACVADPVFGALPYQPHQSMHMEGDSTRFNETFAFKPAISIIDGLRALIEKPKLP